MRIAIGGIAIESCTFSTLPSTLNDFTIVRSTDADFWDRVPFYTDFPDVEFIPVMIARALPGGPVVKADYETMKAELLNGLKALLPLDGVYLQMHGAMNVLDMDDAEGDWIQSVRQTVGADCMISASYDLHGNVSGRVFDSLDILTAYRTAPHIDYMETNERAVKLLVACLHDGIRPYKKRIPIPVGLPGEKTSTEWEPGYSIYYDEIPKPIDGNNVMDTSILVGYVWADEPRMTACAIAIGQDESAVNDAAKHLAQVYWDKRADFQFGVPAMSVDECVQNAMEDDVMPVVISDSGDNPTAGGVGDVTYFLEHALAINPPDMVYASIPDAAAVRACIDAGIGATVSLDIGGKFDYRNSKPLPINGSVKFILTPENQPDNRQVVLQSGGIQVILTEKRTPFHYVQQFHDLNIDPEAHNIIVIKVGYLVPEIKAIAKKAYLALSPGAVNQDITSLRYERIQRPCYPFDPDMTWEPTI